MRAGIKGLIITAAFIGPGTVTTATVVGGQTGFTLVWLLAFAILATYTLQEMASRLGSVSGLGLSQAIMQSLQSKAARILIGALVIAAIGIGNAAYEGGNITGAALGLSASFGASIQTWALTLGVIAALLLLTGHYSIVEKCLVGLVVLMSIVFISLMFVVGINTDLLAKGLTFSDTSLATPALALAIVGTTIVPYNLFLHAGLSAQDKQNNKDIGSVSQQNKELAISIGMGGLVTFAILSSSVTAFFATQISVDKSNIASQLAPLLGDNAALFFGIGLFAAGLTSALTAPLAAAFAISGLFGWGNTLKDLRFKATAISIVAIGTFAASLGLKPLALIILAQTSNALLLPISAILLVWVCNRPDLMGNYANSKLANIAGGLVILLVLMLAAYKLFG
jgi:NRAMP (natural resistance-associated macrophage protein)-like metal ion transporter